MTYALDPAAPAAVTIQANEDRMNAPIRDAKLPAILLARLCGAVKTLLTANRIAE
jgi:hypothetical protein